MSDLIDRQAAIDALHAHLMYRMGTESNKKRLDEWINSLPSSQPETHEERTETHACDLISRQAAIDAIYHHLPSVSRTRARTMLHEVPSAQPEIIRCKDCKHFHYDMPYVIQGIPVLGHEVCDFWGDGCKTGENGFCSYAERENR